MPGMARKPSTMRLRRRAYSASIVGTDSMEPCMASRAAYCAMEVALEVDWLCNLTEACTGGWGARVYPMRQPVMAKVLAIEPMMTTWSLEPAALAMEYGLCG